MTQEKGEDYRHEASWQGKESGVRLKGPIKWSRFTSSLVIIHDFLDLTLSSVQCSGAEFLTGPEFRVLVTGL